MVNHGLFPIKMAIVGVYPTFRRTLIKQTYFWLYIPRKKHRYIPIKEVLRGKKIMQCASHSRPRFESCVSISSSLTKFSGVALLPPIPKGIAGIGGKFMHQPLTINGCFDFLLRGICHCRVGLQDVGREKDEPHDMEFRLPKRQESTRRTAAAGT